MFCPKCGSQNADETKFCRGCGAELTNVLAVVDGRKSDSMALAEKYITSFSRGVAGVSIGVGFLIISGIVFSIPPIGGFFWLLPLAFAVLCLSGGISRFVQAKGIKSLIKRDETSELPPMQTEFIKPTRSIYQTDELLSSPSSVTEHTTRHLKNE